MSKKKFSINDLNAVGDATQSVVEAFQQNDKSTESRTEPKETETDIPAHDAPQEESTVRNSQTVHVTEVTVKSEAADQSEDTEEYTKKKAKKTHAKKAEEIKMVGVQIPMSLFKKLTMLKLETGTPVRQICLELIEEGVKTYKENHPKE